MTNDQNFVPEDHEDQAAEAAKKAAEASDKASDTAGEDAVESVVDSINEAVFGEQQAEPDAEDAPSELSELDQALLKVAELEENLARRNADLYNLQQEYNGYVKRSKADGLVQYENGVTKVLDTLLSVLDDAALARQHGDLDGPAGTIVDKLEQTLETNFQLVRYGAEGDEFDPELHDALMNQTSPDVQTQQIAQLIQPGYRQGDKVIRPARVGVVSPE
ncbi:nucleotide exchange factor GrpE [Trueperella bialowiezensis]|uniref:Protein GrpE n=1 Tax=Trueperella bialowiezensis TaxID=312285 RepID=A0A3S4YYD2_9ACTO|nr:nucleotide exchange factor GrpE [Trueperella bialowiezensis]VEI13552.1 HSP-70 cofactor [Trueperella bialowiezensis]